MTKAEITTCFSSSFVNLWKSQHNAQEMKWHLFNQPSVPNKLDLAKSVYVLLLKFPKYRYT